jgi:hypothetical protein
MNDKKIILNCEWLEIDNTKKVEKNSSNNDLKMNIGNIYNSNFYFFNFFF